MSLSPIVLFVYKRLRHTRQTIEALLQNHLSDQSLLFIYSDGPKNCGDSDAVDDVRSYLQSINGFKDVTIIQRTQNLGLASSVIIGITEILDQFEKVVVLEDDMVTSPYFLTFMNEGLDAYQLEDRVISVHGYLYPLTVPVPETFFLRGADCWGWGTWKRGWECFNPDGRFLMEEIRRRRLVKEFNFNGTFDYFGMLSAAVSERIDSWAIRWHASAFLEDKLTLYPGRSLVRNIGNDASGTHCGYSCRLDVDLSLKPVRVGDIPIEENHLARSALENFFSSLRRPRLIRLINKLFVKSIHI